MEINDKRITHLNQYLNPDQIRTNFQDRADIIYTKPSPFNILSYLFDRQHIQTQFYVDGILMQKEGPCLYVYERLVDSGDGARKKGRKNIPLRNVLEYNRLIKEEDYNPASLEDKASEVEVA